MAAIDTSVVVMLRELAFRVTQIVRGCSDPKTREQLNELSLELMGRAKEYEDLLEVPRNQ